MFLDTMHASTRDNPEIGTFGLDLIVRKIQTQASVLNAWLVPKENESIPSGPAVSDAQPFE